MKEKPKPVVWLLIALLTAVTAQIVFASSEFTSRKSYDISDPYEYPVTADSEQWSSFTTTAQMFEACQVPENIAEDMSTEALLQTVIDYPMLITVLAQSDQNARYNMLFEYNAALQDNRQTPSYLDNTDGVFYDKIRWFLVRLQLYISLRQDYAAAADLYRAFVAVCFNMAEDYRRAVHFFSLDETAVIAAPDESVEIAVISQSAVGSACRRFFIDVVQRGEVADMACSAGLGVRGESVYSYNLIFF